MSEQRKAIVIGALAELYGKALSQPGLILYVHALRDVDADAVEQAAAKAAQQCKFMPLPVELRELAGDARPEDRALLAWEVFASAVEGVGWYHSPDFDDPIINATVRSLGGWQKCCETPSSEFDKWLRKDFIATYTGYTRTGVSEDAARPLVGYFERQNAILGYHRPQDRVEVRTGLPWAGQPVKRLGSDRAHADKSVPRITLQKP